MLNAQPAGMVISGQLCEGGGEVCMCMCVCVWMGDSVSV